MDRTLSFVGATLNLSLPTNKDRNAGPNTHSGSPKILTSLQTVFIEGFQGGKGGGCLNFDVQTYPKYSFKKIKNYSKIFETSDEYFRCGKGSER
jgi:hypothetical protein